MKKYLFVAGIVAGGMSLFVTPCLAHDPQKEVCEQALADSQATVEQLVNALSACQAEDVTTTTTTTLPAEPKVECPTVVDPAPEVCADPPVVLQGYQDTRIGKRIKTNLVLVLQADGSYRAFREHRNGLSGTRRVFAVQP